MNHLAGWIVEIDTGIPLSDKAVNTLLRRMLDHYGPNFLLGRPGIHRARFDGQSLTLFFLPQEKTVHIMDKEEMPGLLEAACEAGLIVNEITSDGEPVPLPDGHNRRTLTNNKKPKTMKLDLGRLQTADA